MNSLQGFLDAVNRLLKVNGPVWIIIGRYCYTNGRICSKVSSITGAGQLDLNDLERTESLKSMVQPGAVLKAALQTSYLSDFRHFIG